jgi:hypothetical protein
MTDDTFNPAAFSKPKRLSAQDSAPVDTNETFNPSKLKKRIEDAAVAEEQQVQDLLTAPLGKIKAWSFSRLMKFENCPYAIYLGSVEKAPDPSGPAAERGTIIHEAIEEYIQCNTDTVEFQLKPGMKKIDLTPFHPVIDRLRDGFENGKVEVEGDWGFTRDWQKTGFFADDVWARIKLDALEFQDETSASALDWKTGRKFGNELKHNQQGMVYAIAAFMRYPKLEFVETSFEYLDEKAHMKNHYSRDRAMLLKPMIDRRANELTTATKFPPKPSMHACKWCAHGKIQEGEDAPRCAYAFQEV